MRVIDADQLLLQLSEYRKLIDDGQEYKFCFLAHARDFIAWDALEEMIQNAPTVDECKNGE